MSTAEHSNGAGHMEGRVVAITGGAGGFGRLMAAGAARRGAKVVVSDVDAAAAEEVAAGIRSDGGAALGVRTDVTDLPAMKDLVAAAVDEFGALDVFVNNAGIMPLAFFSDHASAAGAWDRCIDINLKGVLNGMMASHDQMVSQGRGHIVNMSSIYGNNAVAGAAVYGATKAAVNVLSDAFRVESQGRIKVTTVRPTGIPTTGIGNAVVNPAAAVGILGQNAGDYMDVLVAAALGTTDELDLDADSPGNVMLDPADLVDQVLAVIDQPWGVLVSDITVRATGDRYVL